MDATQSSSNVHIQRYFVCLVCLQTFKFLSNHRKEFFKHLNYISSYAHLNALIIPQFSLLLKAVRLLIKGCDLMTCMTGTYF